MHVHELRASNFKRLEAVTIRFPGTGGTVEIAGKNGSGKSSCIDAIFGTLAGADACPDQPIRSGQRAAKATVDLGEFKVTREWDSRGTRLTVVGADGAKVSSPQKLLDGLFARLAFDPLEFTRQSGAVQAATLRRVTGLDFRELDARRAEKYAERTEVNRAVKAAEARLVEMPEVSATEEVEVGRLNAQLQQASRHNGEVTKARLAADRARDASDDAEAEVDRLVQEIAHAVDRMHAARVALEEAEGRVGEEIDTAPILEQIAESDRTNRRARQHRERQAAVEQLAANRAHADRLTDDIELIDAERVAMVQRAKFPVEGLSLDQETVTFRGLPFEQASSAEQIRVSLGMAAALNPRLRLAVIKEGSLLDESSLRLVAEWAEANDYHVLVERVADSTVGPGVVIEEGRVKEPAQAEEAPRLFA